MRIIILKDRSFIDVSCKETTIVNGKLYIKENGKWNDKGFVEKELNSITKVIEEHNEVVYEKKS